MKTSEATCNLGPADHRFTLQDIKERQMWPKVVREMYFPRTLLKAVELAGVRFFRRATADSDHPIEPNLREIVRGLGALDSSECAFWVCLVSFLDPDVGHRLTHKIVRANLVDLLGALDDRQRELLLGLIEYYPGQ